MQLLTNLARYVTSAVAVVFESKIWHLIIDYMANYKKKETQVDCKETVRL